MTRRFLHIAFLGLALSICACNEPEDAWVRHNELTEEVHGEFQSGLWVANEGNFGWGYGTVSWIDLETGQIRNNIFRQINGRILGNVVQSMYRWHDRIYIVVNNSQKIEVVDARDFSSIGRIDGLISPRYFLPIHQEKAYVTDLYARGISIMNPITLQKTGIIQTSGWTEKMLNTESHILVCHPGGNEILVLDPEQDKVTANIALAAPPMHIEKDRDNYIWVLCGRGEGQRNFLYRISPNDYSIDRAFEFPREMQGAGGLAISKDGSRLYFLSKHVYTMMIDEISLPETPLIQAEGGLFYNLGIDPVQSDLYVADALDYLQNGWVNRYTPEGMKVDAYRVGVIPGYFLFNNP
ncbi:MAG: hypothetical protein JJU28_16120 [Cyclobacteriaceae bacterium]|nr:hypothetical protein [Cyclobacteriaceae bacterium]